MKELDSLSGPWVGMSVQGGFRIQETIRLDIRAGVMRGSGSDSDGDFDLAGSYNVADGQVHLERRYSRVTRGGPDGVGTPYDYFGRWDGAMISGVWMQRDYPPNQGSFEMWPDREEDREELAIALAEDLLVGKP